MSRPSAAKNSPPVAKKRVRPPVAPAALADRLTLTIDETCAVLGIKRTTLWRMTKEGQIKTFTIHGRVVTRRVDLEALVDARYQAGRNGEAS